MNLKIYPSKIWFLFIILIMNEPPLFFNYPLIHSIYKVLQLCLILYALMYGLIKKFYNFPLILLLLFSIWNVFVTFILKTDDVVTILYRYLYMLAQVIFICQYVKNECSQYLNIYTIVLGWYSIINCIVYIITPRGWIYRMVGYTGQNIYFLGLDNQFAKIVIPSIVLMMITGKKSNLRRKIFYMVVLFSNIYIVVGRMPGTFAVCLFLIIVLWISSHYIDISARIMAGAYAVMFSLFVLNQSVNISFINTFVEQYLGKEITFSGRTNVWRKALIMFGDSPLIGYGCYADGNMINGISAHNIILQTLLESGIIGIIILLFIFYETLLKYKGNNKIIQQAGLGVFTIMLSLMFEVYSLEYLFVVLFAIYQIRTDGNHILDKGEKNE